MAYQLQDITRALESNPTDFIRACEADYAAQISQAADTILKNLPNSPLVLLSGPSGSGKTTSAIKLEELLRKKGITAHAVALDNYFRPLEGGSAPLTPEGTVDYESPLLMDMELLSDTFTRLSQGEEVSIPRFDFARQRRNPDKSRPLRLGKNEIAIFEGIHALNNEIAGPHPEAATMYISAHSNILDGAALCFKRTWMRISRRAVRDLNFRGTDLVKTLQMWNNVRRGEKLYIAPYRDRANIVVDSALAYEPAVFARYAPALHAALEEIGDGNPRFKEFHQMLDTFARFPHTEEALVPPDSMLREFIGGGIYKYK